MIIVSDATPIISFVKMNKLQLLNDLYGDVLLPDAVYKEVTTNPQFSNEAKKIMMCSFIRKVQVDNREKIAILKRATGLDLGESEAIVYSDMNKADLIIVDEIKARRVAMSMNLRITGTIGTLILANQEGLLEKNEAIKCVDILKQNHRHISDALYRTFVEELI